VGIEIKTKVELVAMRDAGRVVAQALDALEAAAKPGVTLLELEEIAAEHIKRSGATSSFLHYKAGRDIPPYPKVLCASVNEVVVHGIPSSQRLVEGDIVGLDFGVHVRGYHGDASRTVTVGKVSTERQKLVDVARQALEIAIGQARPGNRVGDIGAAVQAFIEGNGFSVVRDFVGHGIGRRMHEEPQVPNYGKPRNGPRLKPGMVIAIEPMVNEGGFETEILPDRWTVVTKDRRPSAHFEHTVAITETGSEILTLP
jgi:methionyl aminopeptidase